MLKAQDDYASEVKSRIDKLAENFYRDPEYVAKESHAAAMKDAIREIEGWEMLQIKAFNELPFANPKEAEREHKNTMNLLGVIKSKLIKKTRPLPPDDTQGNLVTKGIPGQESQQLGELGKEPDASHDIKTGANDDV